MFWSLASRLGAGLVLAVLAVTVVPETVAAQGEDAFTIIVVPDTQNYTGSAAGEAIFQAEFDWIAANQVDSNIVFVTHVGDVANNPSDPTEWDLVERVWNTLDNTGIPYGIAAGNHDIDLQGNAVEFDARFGVARYEDFDWFGGAFAPEAARSSYQTVSIDGHELLFLHIRHLKTPYGPLEPVIDWAGDVLAAHPDHLAFVTTHEFTSTDGSIVMPELLTELRTHCNVTAIFSGHRPGGVGHGTYADDCGRQVNHVLTNLQFLPDGGGGFLRQVTVDRVTLEASFSVYSPVSDTQFDPDNPASSFTTSLAPLPIVPGDVDCDRAVTIQDARRATQFAILLIDAELSCPLRTPGLAINVMAGDLDGDGSVSIADARSLTLCAVGIEEQCP